MTDLKELIIQNIRENGPISFKDFMETSLYSPGLGYYTSQSEQFGCTGDYFTSSTLTPLFGEMISKQIIEMWHQLGKKDFTVVEYGAGNGMLCSDILENLEKQKNIYDSIDYIIIEKSNTLREKQKSNLSKKVQWIESIHQISNFSGCVLSNELVDNFAVHVVVMQDELMEVYIDHADIFYEVLRPANDDLKNYFHEQNISLPKGFRTEVNLQAIEWLKEISESLHEGFILTIDYGCTAEELYASNKKYGTLLCYHNHQINDNPYKNIGQQDITTHVNFSALKHWGNKHHLNLCGYTTQAHFLRSMGMINKLRELEMGNIDQNTILKLKAVLFSMGEKIKIMVQQKGLKKPFLSGIQFQLPI